MFPARYATGQRHCWKSAQPLLPARRTPRKLLHELQVQQIELEMQNEGLRQAQAEIQAGLARYADLYDLAPVAYLRLGRDGRIEQANLLAASLLGMPRSQLEGRRLAPSSARRRCPPTILSWARHLPAPAKPHAS